MKTLHEKCPGVSIIETLLMDSRKRSQLLKILDHFNLKINTAAELKDKNYPWILKD
jgi:hypothetical protein